MDNNSKMLLEKNPIISKMLNNDFLIIPLKKVIAVNVNEEDEELRLHIDILKGEK